MPYQREVYFNAKQSLLELAEAYVALNGIISGPIPKSVQQSRDFWGIARQEGRMDLEVERAGCQSNVGILEATLKSRIPTPRRDPIRRLQGAAGKAELTRLIRTRLGDE